MPATLVPPPAAGTTFDHLIASLKEAATLPAALTAIQAAKYLGISKPSLYRGVSSGAIPAAVDTPGGPRWRRKDLDKYLDRLKPRK